DACRRSFSSCRWPWRLFDQKEKSSSPKIILEWTKKRNISPHGTVGLVSCGISLGRFYIEDLLNYRRSWHANHILGTHFDRRYFYQLSFHPIFSVDSIGFGI